MPFFEGLDTITKEKPHFVKFQCLSEENAYFITHIIKKVRVGITLKVLEFWELFSYLEKCNSLISFLYGNLEILKCTSYFGEKIGHSQKELFSCACLLSQPKHVFISTFMIEVITYIWYHVLKVRLIIHSFVSYGINLSIIFYLLNINTNNVQGW